MIGCSHQHHSFLFIDLVKEAPSPNAVSPGGRLPMLEALNIRTAVRLVSELGIHVFS